MAEYKEISSTTHNISLPKTYIDYVTEGGKLHPGLIVYVTGISNEYEINNGYTAHDRDEKPYLIWGIIGEEQIYAFPISNPKDSFKYEVGNNSYSVADLQDSLELNPVCLRFRDIAVVDANTTAEELTAIMDIQYKKIYHLHKGKTTPYIKTFINTVNKNRYAEVGDVIVNYDFDSECPRYYYVYDVDKKHQKYKTYEVDSTFTPPKDGKIVESYLDMRQPRLKIESIPDKKTKGYLSSLVPFESAKLQNFVGHTFWESARRLMIIKENMEEGYYVCADVTESLSPQAIDIVLVSNTVSLLNVKKESPRISGPLASKVRKYMRENPDMMKNARNKLARQLKLTRSTTPSEEDYN